MARISRAHRKRIALVTCLAALFAALSFGAPAANADVLDAVTGQVEAVVSPVEQQVLPPVQQVGETLTAPTKAASAGNAPGVEVPDAVSAPPVAELGAHPGPATSAVTGVAAAAGAAARPAPDAVATAKEDAEAATEATLPAPVPSTLPDPASPSASAPEATVPADPGTNPTYALPSSPSSQANAYVPPPANDGSTGAPLPRWVAYVWPAVALTGPDLANFAARWSQASTDLATGAAAGSGAAQGVAGVHASGGRSADSGSSSLFSRIPSAGGHAFNSVPTSVWLYLGLLVLAVIAVALAVRREVATGRRQY